MPRKLSYNFNIMEFIREAAMRGERAGEVRAALLIKFPGIDIHINYVSHRIAYYRHYKEMIDRRNGALLSKKAEMRKMLSETVPEDTRNFTQRFMGDPLPGRSALDRSKKQHASSNT